MDGSINTSVSTHQLNQEDLEAQLRIYKVPAESLRFWLQDACMQAVVQTIYRIHCQNAGYHMRKVGFVLGTGAFFADDSKIPPERCFKTEKHGQASCAT